MIQLSSDILRQVAPQFGGQKGAKEATIIQEVGAALAQTLAKFRINSELRVAHFLVQTCEESDGYCTTVEYASGGVR
jgi:putative chitinase